MSSDDFVWNREDPLARAKYETTNANRALNRYVQMRPGATYRDLRESFEGDPDAPTTSLATIHNWSSRYDWTERVAAYYDIRLAGEREAYEEAVRDELRQAKEVLEAAGEKLRNWLNEDGGFSEKKLRAYFYALGVYEAHGRKFWDRGETINVKHSGTVSITSEDVMRAQQEVDAWEQQQFDD